VSMEYTLITEPDAAQLAIKRKKPERNAEA
jgi:hypothetical protein